MKCIKLYTEKLEHIKKQLKETNGTVESVNAYAYFSANLKHFMPLLDWDRHWQLYLQFRENNALNALDVLFMDGEFPLPITGWGYLSAKLLRRHGIICTFHFGAYQLINYLLLRDKIKFALLVGDEVRSTWDSRYPNLMKQMQLGEKEGRFKLLNAGEAAALKEIYRLVRAGYQLVIYADGLTGTGTASAKNLVEITFLGQHIYVPGGVAALAHRLQCPIYPLLALRKEGEIVLRSRDAISAPVGMPRPDFVRTTTTALFGFLATFLMHAPQQWTVWTQLQRLLLPERGLIYVDEINNDVQGQDRQRYGLIHRDRGDSRYFLLDKRNYHIYALKQQEYVNLFNQWCK
ncbi:MULTISPECIES: hypothetical protein [Sphingobacterium]|uniref:hypothetical protein n=1 Tax=Sphingobacterium TaxID=28453 RepID=UPI00257CC4DF|nr:MULTISPECIES: hypothetical protein [Sphingobacterium]